MTSSQAVCQSGQGYEPPFTSVQLSSGLKAEIITVGKVNFFFCAYFTVSFHHQEAREAAESRFIISSPPAFCSLLPDVQNQNGNGSATPSIDVLFCCHETVDQEIIPQHSKSQKVAILYTLVQWFLTRPQSRVEGFLFIKKPYMAF